MAEHAATVRLRGVAAAGEDADAGECLSGFGKDLPQLGEGTQQVATHVVVEGFERRHVEDAGMSQRPLAADEAIEGPQKSGEGLAAAGGGGDENVLAAGDQRPGSCLHIGGRADALGEPAGDQGMKEGQLRGHGGGRG